jgi:hypothetical protein
VRKEKIRLMFTAEALSMKDFNLAKTPGALSTSKNHYCFNPVYLCVHCASARKQDIKPPAFAGLSVI